jgi:endo-beta-N-acetylglucosaminidase D
VYKQDSAAVSVRDCSCGGSGVDVSASVCEYYRPLFWSFVDVFVYFSHAFVTIPPPGWIAAGHAAGVPVLGTIITEWQV